MYSAGGNSQELQDQELGHHASSEGGNSQVGVYKEGGGESQVSQCKEHGQQAPQGREDSQDEVAKERSSSQASCCKEHEQEARQEDDISQVRITREGDTSQAELYLNPEGAQEQRGTECIEEAEPVLAWPARPRWKRKPD